MVALLGPSKQQALGKFVAKKLWNCVRPTFLPSSDQTCRTTLDTHIQSAQRTCLAKCSAQTGQKKVLISRFAFNGSPSLLIREFKKVRRQLQRKRHIKIELCVKLSHLRLFHVDHVVQNTRIAFSLAWYERFSCKGKEWKIYCCQLALSSEPQTWKFHVVVWQTTSKQCSKKRAARAARLFFFVQPIKSLICGVVVTLPSSNLKFPIDCSTAANSALQRQQYDTIYKQLRQLLWSNVSVSVALMVIAYIS